ncbi:crossover junction endodeoxyribonuclease RuvC [Dysgonomonas sp. ZJ709]|uniref:crossover junction endodeoxyribonuclease RuvC n=1 Tax=Dysgonomonas sp. ZJ709 TaxID=2709797 RepID=UPI0013EACFB6|nr:crossover junction endodeoxyribonuclease RuvC [Dysgonomonas sp. ZJ709]
MENNLLKKEELLALDIATHTGYYSLNAFGTWNFTESKKRNNNKQHKDFRDTIMGFVLQQGIRHIVAEDINVNNYFSDMRKLSEFRGILFEICDELNLPEPTFVNVATLKKWATDNGRASKQEMMQACKDRYNFLPDDDNVSDACHLYHYYIRKYRIF